MKSRSPPGVWVVIAAYNEEKVVADVIAEVRRTGHQIVVVVDGATDATAAVAADAGATVLNHPFNLGQGAALQTGIEFVLLKGAEFVVTFARDGQHRATDIALPLES